jgi:acetyl esterase/lipase
MRDGHANEARVFKCQVYPKNSRGPPLVALAYGGGFMSGSNLQFAPIARAVVLECKAVVVTVSYR